MTSSAGRYKRRKTSYWPGYLITFLAEVAITAALKTMLAYFPLGGYPIPYILLIMVVAYCFGMGPTVLAFVMGLVSFTLFFIPPDGLWPLADTPENWARLTAFLLGTLAVGLATTTVRRSRQRIERLAEEVDLARRIAEQRKTELETILESMAGGVVVTDKNLKVVYANPTATRIVPAKREIGQTLGEWLKAGNVRRMDGTPLTVDDHPVSAALRGDYVSERQLLVDGQSGANTMIGATAAPLRDENRSISGAVVVIRDVTLQTKMQNEIEEQRALLDTFISDVPIGLAFLDKGLRYSIINPAMGRMLNIRTEAAIGKLPTEERFTEASREAEQAAAQVLETGVPVFWHERTHPNGKCFNVVFLPVETAEGEILGVGVVTMDVSDQVNARHMLQASYERERRIAEALQTNLVGAIPERIRCFSFETMYRAAMDEARVGGDFYDVFSIGDDEVAVVIGDVSGKGLNSAVQMAIAKYSLRGRAYSADGPAAMLAQLNRTMALECGPDGFVTCFVGVLDCRTRRLTYANGGHEPVLMWRDREKTVQQIRPTGPIVGIMDCANYDECTIELEPGDELLLATDGLIEVKCLDGYLDIEGLIDIYSDKKHRGEISAEALVGHITQICSTTLRDDTAVLRVMVE